MSEKEAWRIFVEREIADIGKAVKDFAERARKAAAELRYSLLRHVCGAI